MPDRLLTKWQRYLWVFGLAFVVGLSFFLPYMIINKGPFMFFGDFDVQQIPFYRLAHDAIRSGNIFWSWTTDLGSNFIGSYSFYLIGSPFFWLTIPFPSSAINYMMGWLLILKFSCATVTSYALIARFVKNHNFALIGALIYSFSGFGIYNIFFNHFIEPMIFFPLLIIALEECVVNDRKGVLAAAVAVNLTVDYFFFIGELVFLFLYWFLRSLTPDWKMTGKKLISIVVEGLIGLSLSAFLLFPSVLTAISNPRTKETLNGWDNLIYGDVQRYFAILQTFFFPPDLPSRPNFLPNGNAKWASIAAWLPLFGMTGVIAFLQSVKNNWLKRIIYISLLMSLVPILNSVFYAFNSSYYARWFFMPVLMMALATAKALDSTKVNWNRGIKWSMVITLAVSLGIGIAPVKNGENTTYGLAPFPDRFLFWVAVALVSLFVVYLLINMVKRNNKKFVMIATISLCVIISVYANYFLATGISHGYNRQWIKTDLMDQKIVLDDAQNVRTDAIDAMDNMAMFWQIPELQTFQSVVPNSIMTFYPAVGVTRDVASRPDFAKQGLRALLSVRYVLDVNEKKEIGQPGWKFLNTQLKMKADEWDDNTNSFIKKNYQINVWENENYIPIGFTFDNYLTQNDFDTASQDNRDRLLLKGLLLSDKQIKKYGNYFSHFSLNSYPDYSYDALVEDSAALRKTAATYLKHDNTGFTSKIYSTKDTLAFYSVPWEEGWTATVNGKPAAIEKVDVGFMAVKIDGGKENIVRFNYMTPGLIYGVIVTAAGFILLALYLYFWYLRRKNYPKFEEPPTVYAEDEYFADCIEYEDALPLIEKNNWNENENAGNDYEQLDLEKFTSDQSIPNDPPVDQETETDPQEGTPAKTENPDDMQI